MKSMQLREFTGAEAGMIVGVDYGSGVRLMVELMEPFQPAPFTDEVHWKARVWRGTHAMARKYDGAIIGLQPAQRILVPSKQ